MQNSQKWPLVFHEFLGRDDELDSYDEQHDGDELTTPDEFGFRDCAAEES